MCAIIDRKIDNIDQIVQIEVTSECNRYINFEVALQCRAEGNLLKYGLPKCKRFASAYANFTQTGQEFIECTAKCLADDFGRQIVNEM